MSKTDTWERLEDALKSARELHVALCACSLFEGTHLEDSNYLGLLVDALREEAEYAECEAAIEQQGAHTQIIDAYYSMQ